MEYTMQDAMTEHDQRANAVLGRPPDAQDEGAFGMKDEYEKAVRTLIEGSSLDLEDVRFYDYVTARGLTEALASCTNLNEVRAVVTGFARTGLIIGELLGRKRAETAVTSAP